MRLLLFFLSIASLVSATPHPRLLFTSEMENEVNQRIQLDPLMKTIHGLVVERANQILTERTSQHLIPDGRRLLAESRRSLRNILYCGMAWRTTKDPRFRDRVIQELDAASALKDWNPSHFLDTAEMAAAVAIGYDWLYHSLNPEQRQRYEDALITKSLKALPLKYGKTPWWFRRADSNWSQVCATGINLAADATREREPELSARILTETGKLLDDCGKLYLPHGGYPEGPGYWHYGTNYHVFGLAASETMKGKLVAPAILERSGDFILQMNGPSGINFNFADGGASRKLPTAAQSWIASHFSNPQQAAAIREQLTTRLQQITKDTPRKTGALKDLGSYFPLHLLWLPTPPAQDAGLPLIDQFGGQQAIAMARTGWQSDDAWFAMKGGTGAVSHGQLDVGSFIYEAGGVRWFHDLGADNYNLPGYFRDKRWNYFRLQNRSHNTLVIGDQLQTTPKIGCPLSSWKKSKSSVSLLGNLSTAYAGQAKQVMRRATFDLDDGGVVIRDEISAPTGEVRWAVVTHADIKISGATVILKQDGRRLIVTRIDQAGGAWQEFSLKPPTSAEHQNEGRRMFGFIAKPQDALALEVQWHLE